MALVDVLDRLWFSGPPPSTVPALFPEPFVIVLAAHFTARAGLFTPQRPQPGHSREKPASADRPLGLEDSLTPEPLLSCRTDTW